MISNVKVFEKLEKKGNRKRELKQQREAAAAAASLLNLNNNHITINTLNNDNINDDTHYIRKPNEEKELIWQAKVNKEPKPPPTPITTNNKNKTNNSKNNNNNNCNLNDSIDYQNVNNSQNIENNFENQHKSLDVNNNDKNYDLINELTTSTSVMSIQTCGSLSNTTTTASETTIVTKIMLHSDKKFNETIITSNQNLPGLATNDENSTSKKVI